MSDFDRAYAQAIELEGGYKLTNHQADNGGMTYAGISRRSHPTWDGWAIVDVGQQVPTQVVRNFYLGRFWLRFRCDQIADQDVAECVFLGAINAEASVRLLQMVLGFSGSDVDGVIGPKTLEAINAAEPGTLIDRFTLAKIVRYVAIVERDKTQAKWFLGWVRRALKEAVRG